MHPVKITEPKPGVYVFDLGQNFAGFARLKVRGPAGTKVVLRFAEMLNPDGTIYTDQPPRRPGHRYLYSQGRGRGGLAAAVHFPRLPLRRGDRLPRPPGQGRHHRHRRELEGARWTASSSVPAQWSIGSTRISCGRSGRTYISVPTDCPQRDERLGWTGDAETFVRAATYNADVAAFFTKWLVDLDDAQEPRTAISPTWPRRAGIWAAAWPPGPTPARSAPGRSTRSTTTSGSWRSITTRWSAGSSTAASNSKDLLRSGGRLRRLALDQRRHADGRARHGLLRL